MQQPYAMSLAPLGHKKIGPRAPTPGPRREYALWRTLVVTSKGTHTTLPIPVARCREGIHKKRPRRDDPKGLDERIDMKT